MSLSSWLHKAEGSLRAYIQPKPFPRLLALHITNECTMCCAYCAHDSSPGERGSELGLSSIRRALAFVAEHCKPRRMTIRLSGGEPLCHPDFFEIVKEVLRLGGFLRFQTNGMLLNDLTAEQLRILSAKEIDWSVSLDGWDRETHETFRDRGSFDLIMEGIAKLRASNPRFFVKTLVHEKNFPELEKMLDLCLQLHAIAFSVSLLERTGRGAAMPLIPISELDVLKKLVPYFKDPKYAHLAKGTRLARYAACRSNRILYPMGFDVDSRGDVRPCVFDDSGCSIGNIHDALLEDVFRADRVEPCRIPVPEEILEYVRSEFPRTDRAEEGESASHVELD